MKLDYKDTVYTEQLTETQKQKMRKAKTDEWAFFLVALLSLLLLWVIPYALA
jgi:predicted nucleic acid-binding protein